MTEKYPKEILKRHEIIILLLPEVVNFDFEMVFIFTSCFVYVHCDQICDHRRRTSEALPFRGAQLLAAHNFS